MRAWLRSVRPALALVALAFGAPGLVAAGDADAATADQDTLAAARRQLDALKADANSRAAGVSGSALPSISVPQLTTSADAPPAPMTPSPLSAADRAKLKRQREAENWLIEGVRKQERADAEANRLPPDRRAGSRAAKDDALSLGPSGDPGDDSARDPLTALSLDSDAPTTDSAAPMPRADRASTPPSTPAPDPLGHFLDGWLSPNDPLRKVATLPAGGDDSALPARGVRMDSAGDDAASVAALRDLGLPGGNGDTSAAPTGTSAENPFLSFLSSSSPPEMAQPANPPPAGVPALPPAVTPPPAESSSNSPLPDFVRPDDNDKYFKPLKRF